ncbi:hypothetical protein LEMLEM_LOCUS23208 [Lemmus lemmus]
MPLAVLSFISTMADRNVFRQLILLSSLRVKLSPKAEVDFMKTLLSHLLRKLIQRIQQQKGQKRAPDLITDG